MKPMPIAIRWRKTSPPPNKEATYTRLPSACRSISGLVINGNRLRVATLTNGDPGQLLSETTYTPRAGGGCYSSYVGAVVDIARILGNAHTAHYQYIPALALPKADELNLGLNNPPSFRNPKSVLVIGLPHVGPTLLPRLRPIDPNQAFCLDNPELELPAEGAPLVFGTVLAHYLVLHIKVKTGEALDLPVTAKPARGGFVVSTKSLQSKDLNDEVIGAVRGMWGFQTFEGPRFRLHTSGRALGGGCSRVRISGMN